MRAEVRAAVHPATSAIASAASKLPLLQKGRGLTAPAPLLLRLVTVGNLGSKFVILSQTRILVQRQLRDKQPV